MAIPRFRSVSKAALFFCASIALSATVASADPQTELRRDLMFSPNPDLLRHDNGQRKRPSQPSNKAVPPRPSQSGLAKFPKEYWLFDWQEGYRINRGLDTGTRNSIGAGDVKSLAPTVGATSQNDPGPFGRSSLQFRTEKNFQTPEPFRRTDCYNEDECADYSPFPKSRPSKTTAKNVRKPFLGLSITTPIQ